MTIETFGENLPQIPKDLDDLRAKVAQQEQVIRELKLQKAGLEKILNVIPAGIYVYDSQFRFTYVNNISANAVGQVPVIMIGKTAREIGLPLHMIEPLEEGLKKVFDTGASYENQTYLTFGLNRHDYHYVLSPLFGPEGRVEAVLSTVQDISDRKKAEKALLESEERYRALADATFEGVAIHQNGIVLEANQSAADMLGYERSELIGSSMEKFCKPDDYPSILKRYATGDESTFETYALRKDGSSFPIEAQPKNSTFMGNHVRVIAVRDITQRKKNEEALQKTEERLRQAQKMEAIGRLAGGVAHDFNNLLTVIMSYSSLALSTVSPDDPLHNDLLEIERAVEKAAMLTGQLLAFSRQQVIQPHVVEINSLIKGLGKMLRRLIPEDIELHIQTGEGKLPIFIDTSQLEQVIMNLVINASDATLSGGKIVIETTKVEFQDEAISQSHKIKSGSYVVLTVSDQGTGMNPETLAHIFEPFFTTKELGKGTGLGLSTVYAIVEQNKGFIQVSSQQGYGTTFKVCLPEYVGESFNTALIQSSDIIYPKGSDTILLVEDEESVRSLATRILSDAGYNILEAQNGVEALRIAREYPDNIDLMITDALMPKMSGHELSEKVNNLRPNTPILLISGYTDRKFTEDEKQIFYQAFLQKPFTPRVLLEKVRGVLDSKRD